MQLRNRFVFDPEENILFIDFAGLRIETREQVDETRRLVREILESRGRRAYAIVNYEGTEIAPEIVDYYGESIKELYDRYSLTTVRYSSSGLTRSVLRYLGAAKDLESNIFTTREEAIRAGGCAAEHVNAWQYPGLGRRLLTFTTLPGLI
ncbi:MAG: hypothetical protein M3R69_02540 [Acidobacteriota bacterium]|nr:hypothetical protein [Acidobacteriota bacterium]